MNGEITSSVGNSAQINKYLTSNLDAPNVETNPCDFLVWHTLQMITKVSDEDIQYFDSYTKSLVANTNDVERIWHRFKNAMAEFSVNVDDLILSLCIKSFDLGQAQVLRKTLRRIANASRVPAVVFQAAFLEFNLNAPQACIDLLSMIELQTSQVLTLKAQAFQDLKDFENAHECLLLATEVNPSDLFSWFHLARNGLACKKIDSAWEAISVADRMSENNEEIKLLKLMIGLERHEQIGDKGLDLFADTLAFFSQNGINESLFETLCPLVTTYGDETWFIKLCEYCDFSQLTYTAELITYFTQILRRLHLLKWHQASVALNDGIQTLISATKSRKPN